MATNAEKLEEAVDLVVREYQKKGYLDRREYQNSKEKFLNYLDPEFSRTFIAKREDKVIGTMSVVLDSNRGLPMEEFYKEEVVKLRAGGKRIAEIVKFAIDSKCEKKHDLIQNLFSTVFKYGLSEKLDYYCIAINPKHESIYQSLFFKKMGEEKTYASLKDAPVIAMNMNLEQVREAMIDEGLKGSFKKSLQNNIF